MFEFKKTENTEEFDAFVENSHETSFMQTSRWIPLKPTWKPHMFTGYEDGKVVLTALILERSMPVAGKLWYSPSGFIADYENRELVSAFSAFIKAQMKKERVTAYIADPQIVKRITGEDVPETCAKEQNLVNAGFVCNDDRDNYTYQPPMTVAVRLKTDENTYTAEKLLKTFEKGVRYSVRIGSKRGLVTEQYRYSDLCENP